MIFQSLFLPVLLSVCLLATSLPASAEELDMTMQVLKPGEKPEVIIQRIQLPEPEPATPEETPAPEEAQTAVEAITDEVEALEETTTETVTDTVKDINDGTVTLPKESSEPTETPRQVIEDAETTARQSTKTIDESGRETLPEAQQAIDDLHQQESEALSRDKAIEQLETNDAVDPVPLQETPAPEIPEPLMDELPAEESVPSDNLQDTVETLP